MDRQERKKRWGVGRPHISQRLCFLPPFDKKKGEKKESPGNFHAVCPLFIIPCLKTMFLETPAVSEHFPVSVFVCFSRFSPKNYSLRVFPFCLHTNTNNVIPFWAFHEKNP